MREFHENWRSYSHTLQNTFMNFCTQLPHFLMDKNKIGYTWSPVDVVLQFCVSRKLVQWISYFTWRRQTIFALLYKLLIRFLSNSVRNISMQRLWAIWVSWNVHFTFKCKLNFVIYFTFFVRFGQNRYRVHKSYRILFFMKISTVEATNT
jgi:hypothetical protein